jgi:hypothetical protein
VSLEAISGADIKSLLTETIPGIIGEVKGYFNKFLPSQPGITLNFNQNDFIKEMNKHSYLDISPLRAYVPEGLEVTYLEYSEELLESAMHASNVLNGVMSAYTVFLSQLISNSDAKLSTSSFLATHKDLEKKRIRLNEEIGECFGKGSTKAEVSIGEVINRNNDWEKILKNSDAILKLVNNVDRNTLNKKVKECVTMLDVIMEKIKRGELDNASAETVKNLSDGAYHVACELEFFAITVYRAMSFAGALELTAKHCVEVLKK